LPGEYGVLLVDVPAGSPAAKAGLRNDDVILACNGQPVRTVADLQKLQDEAAGKNLMLSVSRKQQTLSVDMTDYANDQPGKR
jgi:serine protease Do